MKHIRIYLILSLFLIGFLTGTRRGFHRSDPVRDREETMVAERADADHALEAYQWFNAQRAYPSGTIPLGWQEKAIRHIRKNNSRTQSVTSSPLSWVSVGPNNLGGRVRSIVVNPLNSNTVYCGSVSGGVWKTTNAGAYWFPLTDDAPNLVVATLALDPVDTNTIYAGTGEGFLNVDALRGIGVLKSTDGGASWAVQNNFSTLSSTGPFYVNKLVIQPDNPSILYAGMTGGIWKTTNGGASWSKLALTTTSPSCVDLVIDPVNTSVLYAAFGLRVTDGIYKTTNGGANWAKFTSSNGFPSTSEKYHRISLAMAPSNHLTLYACVADSLDGTHSIQKTTNGGSTWSTAASKAPFDALLHQTHLGNQGWYDNVIAVHPGDPNTVFTGGNDMFVSTNGGVNWRMLTYGYGGGGVPFMHVDQHAITFDPQNSSIIYFGNDGGVYKTTDGGATVDSINHNLAITQFYSGAVHPTAEVYYGGSQDLGIMRSAALPGWTVPFTGDGGTTLVDFTTPTIIYSEYVFLDILRSSSSGNPNSWSKAMTGIPQSDVGIASGTSDRCDFIAPIAMDPSNSSHLIAGTYKVYSTTNGGTLWTNAGPDLTGDGSGSVGSAGAIISALAIAKSSPSTWYAGTGYTFNGYGTGTTPSPTTKVWVTTNSGTVWDSINRANLPNRYVRAVAVDPANRDRAFLCYSGYGTGHIFRTTNRGAVWTDISANLPDIPANAVVIDPVIASHLILATDLGIFESLDDGASWIQQNSGLANVAVIDLDLRLSDLYLFASTHGRGMFKSSSPIGSPVSPHLSVPVHQNPLLNSYLDIYLMSDTAISAAPPAMNLFVGSANPDTVVLSQVDSSPQTFRGSYHLTASGTAIIRATLQNAAGSLMFTQRSFQVQLVRAAQAATIQTPGGSAALTIGSGALKEDTYFTIMSEKSESRGVRLVGKAYLFGPAKDFSSPAVITLQYDDRDPAAGSGAELCLYRDGGSTWNPVDSWVDPVAHTVSARVTALGLFTVGAGSPGQSHRMPVNFVLSQNYPNPFNPTTTIRYELSSAGNVGLQIYDLTGRLIRSLVDERQDRGGYTVSWNGRDMSDRAVASGVYFYKITVRDRSAVRFQAARKMLLLK